MAISGVHKGQTGTVLSRSHDKAIVQGFNVRKKHVKPTQQNRGSIIQIEKPIQISKLRLCNEKGEPIKVKVKVNNQGERELVYVSGGQDVLFRPVK